MKLLFLLMFTVISVIFIVSTERTSECVSSNSLLDDKGIHNRVVSIKGKVIELNNRDLGVTPASANTTLIFQKDGCKACLVATRPDIEGNYEIHVGVGKYRLIVTNPSPPEYDLIAPDQQRYIDVKSSVTQVVNFDVKLMLPSDK